MGWRSLAAALSSLSGLRQVLLPGHLWEMILKEKLQEYLEGLRTAVTRELRYGKGAAERQGPADTDELLRCFRVCFDKAKIIDVGKKLTYFLATGNLVRAPRPGSVPRVVEAATQCPRGCSPMRSRPQPCALEAATPCTRGCNPISSRLHPYALR